MPKGKCRKKGKKPSTKQQKHREDNRRVQRLYKRDRKRCAGVLLHEKWNKIEPLLSLKKQHEFGENLFSKASLTDSRPVIPVREVNSNLTAISTMAVKRKLDASSETSPS